MRGRGVRYCDEHRGQYAWKKSTPGGYGSHWRKLRNAVLAREPLCRVCNQAGRIKAADAVDHITPKFEGGTDAFENLQPICEACHAKKTAAEARRAQQCLTAQA